MARNLLRRWRLRSAGSSGSISASEALSDSVSSTAAASWSVCAPPAGSATMASMTPSSRQWRASGLNAAAAFFASPASRQRIAAQPSGEMTD